MALSHMKSLRLRAVMRFAKMLGVPVDVHQDYFASPRKLEIKISEESVARMREMAAAVAAGKVYRFKDFDGIVRFDG